VEVASQVMDRGVAGLQKSADLRRFSAFSELCRRKWREKRGPATGKAVTCDKKSADLRRKGGGPATGKVVTCDGKAADLRRERR